MWMRLPYLKNLTFSIPIFCTIIHPSVYHFRKKSTQCCSSWVLFTIICSKYTQFIWFGLLHLWWKSTDGYTKFREIAPQKAGTYTYTMSTWERFHICTTPDLHSFSIVCFWHSLWLIFSECFSSCHLIFHHCHGSTSKHKISWSSNAPW